MRIEAMNYKKDTDTFLIQYPKDYYSEKELDEISQVVQKIFPNNNLLFLPHDFLFSIFKEENPFL